MRLALLLLGVFAAIVAGLHLRDMAAIRARLAGASVVIETRAGPIEIAREGAGAPMLVIHGAGGGHDQGLLLARAMVGGGYAVIAPSRFGYLRSPLPADASTAAQADAFAALMDALGVKSASIVAMSGGVPPALQLAARHPERVSALVLLSSAPFTPFTADAQDLPVPISVYNALFGSNFPYWLLRRVAPGAVAPMFDARPDLRAAMSADEKAFVENMMAAFEPVLDRMAGLRNEGAAIDPAARCDLDKITAPTLIIHARDDGLNPAAVAERLGAEIRNAGLFMLPTGGHLLLGRHDEVRERVAAFLNEAGAPLD